MLNTNHTLKPYRSVKKFLNQPIVEEHLKKIILSAQNMPTLSNTQSCSVIMVKDMIRRKRILESHKNIGDTNPPVLLVFCADLYKTHTACEKHGVKHKMTSNIEGLITAAYNVGLAVSCTINTADRLGYGTFTINSLQANLEEISSLLELPDYTFPISTLCLGYPDEEGDLDLYLPSNTFLYQEHYFSKSLQGYINDYDEDLSAHKETSTDLKSWSEHICSLDEKSNKNSFSNYLSSKKFNL